MTAKSFGRPLCRGCQSYIKRQSHVVGVPSSRFLVAMQQDQDGPREAHRPSANCDAIKRRGQAIGAYLARGGGWGWDGNSVMGKGDECPTALRLCLANRGASLRGILALRRLSGAEAGPGAGEFLRGFGASLRHPAHDWHERCTWT
jgi:hypothetical protein